MRMRPQHQYKLSEESQRALMGGLQKDWRAFQGSVLRSLPHTWDRREGTALRLAHFRKHGVGRKAGGHSSGPGTGTGGHGRRGAQWKWNGERERGQAGARAGATSACRHASHRPHPRHGDPIST